jgi:hypothetical protein
MRRPSRQTALWCGLGVVLPIAFAAVLVPVRNSTRPFNVALLLVVAVVIVSVGGGRLPGAIAAISAAVAFDFFHTQPYFTFTIDSHDDVETTVLLLVVGLVVGHVAARGRLARRREDMRSVEIRRLYRVAAMGARGRAPRAVVDAARDELTALLHLQQCRFERPPFATPLERLERTGVVTWRDSTLHRDGFELPPAGVELEVVGRGRLAGRFVLVPTPGTGVSFEQRVVAVALADEVGAVLAASELPHDRPA